MSDSPVVRVQDVHMAFEGRAVLQGIDLDVHKGEIVVVMGSSGGGKTTLLKVVSGLLRPTAGEVLVEGVSVTRDPEAARKKTGLVFQYAALFDYLDVSENVLFGVRRQRRLSRAQEADLVAAQLREVAMEGTERMMPSELSGGMRKRVGLARALVMEPRVLLYDEPTSGLDPVTAYSIDQLIVETRDRLGVTSLVVSHDVSSVFRVADRIAFLHEGRLVFLGTPEEFRAVHTGPIEELVEKGRAEKFLPGEGPSDAPQ